MSAEAARPAAVVAVDLDGTLLRDTSVSLLLATHLGGRSELEELEAAFAAGSITNAVVADRSAARLTGLRLAEAARVLRSGRWLFGIAEGVEMLHRHRMRVLLTTVTWSFAAEIVARWFGMDAACGTTMDVVDDALCGAVSRHFSPDDKAEFARRYSLECGLDCSRLVAVGDSRSDLPLFALAGFSVAVNASEAAARAATVAIATDDFRDVARLIVAQGGEPLVRA